MKTLDDILPVNLRCSRNSRTITGLVFSLFLCAASAEAQSQIWNWTLKQEGYGRTPFRECNLHVVAVQSQGSMELRCELMMSPPVERTARRELAQEEIQRLKELSEAGELYSGGHTGLLPSLSSTTGQFETLTVICCGRREIVVLVTQHNASFEQDGPRLRLLGQLRSWLSELRERAMAQRKNN